MKVFQLRIGHEEMGADMNRREIFEMYMDESTLFETFEKASQWVQEYINELIEELEDEAEQGEFGTTQEEIAEMIAVAIEWTKSEHTDYWQFEHEPLDLIFGLSLTEVK